MWTHNGPAFQVTQMNKYYICYFHLLKLVESLQGSEFQDNVQYLGESGIKLSEKKFISYPRIWQQLGSHLKETLIMITIK